MLTRCSSCGGNHDGTSIMCSTCIYSLSHSQAEIARLKDELQDARMQILASDGQAQMHHEDKVKAEARAKKAESAAAGYRREIKRLKGTT